MRKCAPVVLFTYNRIEETKKVLDALSKNILAENTDIYVFSNAPIPKKNEDALINELRDEILRFQDRFAHFELIKRERNDGVNANMIDGIDRVIEMYGRIIVLEDDIITCPTFLKYMNDALDYYSGDDDIYTICSYNPAEDITKHDTDTFSWRIFKCWGWGTWLNRWKSFDFNENLLHKVDLYTARHHDVQLSEVLQNDIVFKENHHDDTLDYKIVCRQLSLEKLSIYPRKSLCDNIGLNGRGISGTISEEYFNNNFDLKYTESGFDFSKEELTLYNNPCLFKSFRRNNCLFDFYNRDRDKESLYNNLYYCAAMASCYKEYFYDYFEKNKIGLVSIYGYGNAGKLLYEMIKSSVTVAFFVDKKAEHSEKVFNGLDNLPMCDIMVVTPIFDFYNVEECIMETNPNIKVVSMLDLVINMVQYGKKRICR